MKQKVIQIWGTFSGVYASSKGFLINPLRWNEFWQALEDQPHLLRYWEVHHHADYTLLCQKYGGMSIFMHPEQFMGYMKDNGCESLGHPLHEWAINELNDTCKRFCAQCGGSFKLHYHVNEVDWFHPCDMQEFTHINEYDNETKYLNPGM